MITMVMDSAQFVVEVDRTQFVVKDDRTHFVVNVDKTLFVVKVDRTLAVDKTLVVSWSLQAVDPGSSLPPVGPVSNH